MLSNRIRDFWFLLTEKSETLQGFIVNRIEASPTFFFPPPSWMNNSKTGYQVNRYLKNLEFFP